MVDNNFRNQNPVQLRTTFRNTSLAKTSTAQLVLGNLATVIKTNAISTEIHRDLFFDQKLQHGVDLISLSVQRSRDGCCNSYTILQQVLFNRCIDSFSGLSSRIGSAAATAAKNNYENVNDVDLHFGGSREPNLNGALLGETFAEIVARQLEVIKIGDPKFLSNKLTLTKLNAIRSLTFADYLCISLKLEQVPQDARFPVSSSNPLTGCRCKTYSDCLVLSQFCSSGNCL